MKNTFFMVNRVQELQFELHIFRGHIYSVQVLTLLYCISSLELAVGG